MPFAPRSFGTGRPSLIKPSSAAMQQFRRGSPSVAPVPLRMPARPPVANRMQQYNTPPQMPPDRGGPFVPPPMPREMPTPPGGGGEMSQPGGGGVMIMNPDGSQRPYGTPAPGGNELATTGQRGMPKYDPTGMGGGEMSQPGGGGVMLQQPGGGMSPYGGGGIGGLNRTQDYKRGGQVQAYAKGGRVMAKPVAKKAVKTSTTSSASSRGDGIAQRGKTKGKMR